MALGNLEIGPGTHPLRGFDSVDTVDRPNLTYKAKWGYENLPIPDERYRLVYASHVLEHIPWFKTVAALKDVYRILEPGGRLEVWVPDFAYIIRKYQEGIPGDGWRKHNKEGNLMKWVAGRLFTYGPGEENWHRACFDVGHLTDCMHEAGFEQCLRMPKPRGYDHGKINLGIGGTKPKE